ncbi:MAG: HD domain-containing protein [Schleiferiaceae bacterium]|jgi:HD superfamily phosphodiesterase|nr:HD domain-containing protein [Schleiferiaceae bacterium]
MADYDKAVQYILDKLENSLDPYLYYHGLHHTKDVLSSVEHIALSEGVTEHELNLLKVAAAYHDCGFLVMYKNHEEVSCGIAFEALPRFGFTPDEMETVFGMIKATKVPQSPKNKLEKIICDADLDYLGRDDFEHISDSLYQEFKHWNIVSDFKTWMTIQVNFLENHVYWTDFSKKYRREGKLKKLAELKAVKY